MTKKQRILQVTAIAVFMALLAVACGGGSDDTAGLGDTSQPGLSFDGEDAGVDPAPIATTAPIPLVTDDAADDAIETTDDESSIEPVSAENEWLTTVLHVNDDVVLIPTFDAPNGNQTTIYDINPIENIELEYPLLAETVFGNRLALVVDEYDSTGNWAKVFLPVRPNNTTAWVQTAFFTEKTHDYHITIDLSDNKVAVYKGEVELLNQLAVSGRDGRETPVVRSYIDEMIPGADLSPAYGDWVLSIAAFSEALGTFGGGMPKLALHGTNQPELMGQYVSSGCVRIPNEVVSFIADTVPVGTIVDIIQ